MIAILYEDGCGEIAQSTASDLASGFGSHVTTSLVAAESATQWPAADPEWDDLLIVMYSGGDFPENGNLFIDEYVRRRPDTALLLPVALGSTFRRPPKAAEAIKALEYDGPAQGPDGRLVRRVGAMLGLRLQARDGKIFISYRATDGATIAKQLEKHLTTLGYHPFLDEAKELDGETTILPGSPVQSQINDALSRANLVLLIDTPDAPASLWIKHEVDTADGQLLPILPICFRGTNDPKQGPRFQSLLSLQRWVQLPLPEPLDAQLDLGLLDRIVDEAEKYLCEIFRRKIRVPFLVKKEFVSKGFAWKVLDERLLMYLSSKRHNSRLATKVKSHCSLFDQLYGPALKRFAEFLTVSGQGNFSLFIYDGELLPRTQLDEIVKNQPDEIIILHHQELAALIDSNFTVLGSS